MSTDTPDHGAAISRIAVQGITIPDLATLVGMPPEDVKEALAVLRPVRGKQIRTAVYGLWDAMGILCPKDGGSTVTAEQITEHLQRMKPSQLPVALQSEFWSAQSKRLRYQEEVGDLWRTAKVQLVVADLLKIMREALTLMVDNVDQRHGLTAEQRQAVRDISDAVLADCREKVTEHFAGWDGTEDKEEVDPSRYAPARNEVEGG